MPSRIEAQPGHDRQAWQQALDELLFELDVRVDAFAQCEACPGWRLSFEADPTPSLHYVLSGFGSVHVPGHAPVAVTRDSLVVLPRHSPHAFENATWRGLETRHRPNGGSTEASLPTIRAGQPLLGEQCLVVACGSIHASFGGGLGLFDQIERPLIENFADHPLDARFQALLGELREPSLGTRALTEAFLKQALVLLLRRQLRREQDWPGWLAAFRDPSLAPAVRAILREPCRAFSLEELAAVAGLSRAAFGERFKAALGQPPIEFQKQIRLHKAARLLEDTDMPIKSIAASVGYSSRSYFSRAFRSFHGVDPSDYRAHKDRSVSRRTR